MLSTFFTVLTLALVVQMVGKEMVGNTVGLLAQIKLLFGILSFGKIKMVMQFRLEVYLLRISTCILLPLLFEKLFLKF